MNQALSGVAHMLLRIGFSAGPASNTQVTAQDLTFEELARRLSEPTVGPKDGSYYLRGGDLLEPRRGNEYLRSADLLIIDGDKRLDPQSGEVLNGAPPMEEVTAALDGMGMAYIAHTSHSYVPALLEKWRIVIPAKLKHEAVLKACVGYVVARLQGAGQMIVAVKEMTAWSQAWYMPRVRDQNALGCFKFKANFDGSPLSVSDAIFWYVANQDEESKVAKPPLTPVEPRAEIATHGKVVGALFPPVSMIKQFNAEHGLEWVRSELEARGYRFSHRIDGKDEWRYIAPSSETGVAGVVIFRGKKGDWWVYSHHGDHDALSHEPLDPFGLYAKFYHSGDLKAAARALWKETNGQRSGDKNAGGTVGGQRKAKDNADTTADDDGDSFGAEDVGGNAETAGAGIDGLIRNGRNQITPNIANVMTILRASREWQGVFALDRLAGKVMLLAPIPDPAGRRPNNFQARPLTDGDVIKAVEWFQQNGLPAIGKEAVADALSSIAEERGFDPLEDKLRSLRWDGVPRLETWLETYCGATIDDSQPAEYVRAVCRCYLISAVARALRPGCKVDTALVLSGSQGIGKSTAAQILAYDWFSDALPPIHTKDASDHLRGVWIVEFGEMATASRADVEDLKAFLTRTVERFRPPYGRLEIEYPRRCVFFGTSNREAFLKDDTGNRRFWPVKVTSIDTYRLLADRDQLWAEAVHRFEMGERWHLTDQEVTVATSQQAAYVIGDEREEKLARELAGRAKVTSLEALDLLEMDHEHRNQVVIAGMLRRMGWEQGRDKTRRFWKRSTVKSGDSSGDGLKGVDRHRDRHPSSDGVGDFG